MSAPARARSARLALGLLAPLAACAVAASAAAQHTSRLQLSGMTFVGTRDDASELVVRAKQAVFVPQTNVAQLTGVRAYATDAERGRSFEMTCDRADFNLDTNDISAEGNVVGVTGEGERYSAPWVRYEEESRVLFSDAPVTVENPTGMFSGDGFRYHVHERRFQLLGNVRVVQSP